MSAVVQAGGYARRLVEGEARRSGVAVMEAIPTVARRLKAPPTAVWKLLFRPPKRIYSDLFDSLYQAVIREIRREIADRESELAGLLATRKGVGGINPHALAEIQEDLEEVTADLARLRRVIAEAQ